MGGKDARDGFWFQDAMTLLRVLNDAIARRTRAAFGESPGDLLEVRVEAAVVGAAPGISPRPLWDSTYTVGMKVIVDESKKGGPDRDERIDFWRRLRATIAAGAAAANVSPRFSVERDAVDNDEKWHQLATAALTASPSKPTNAVRNATALAEEALYYLTADDAFAPTDPGALPKPHIPAIVLADARALLGRFILDNSRTTDEVEEALKAALVSIGATWSVEQLVDALGGWINRVARERVLDLVVTADSLMREVSLVGRYLQEPRDVEDLWHRLRSASATLPSSVLGVQSWREVQPAVASKISSASGSASGRRFVLTALGGAGKSFLLGQLHKESTAQRVWMDAQTRDGIESALSFGAWACKQRGESLQIFIDGLDHADSPREILAIVDRALTGYSVDVFVAARATTWITLRDAFPSWSEVPLDQWNEERVRALADAGRASPLARDVVELLRTPLLLDLFLRTFSPNEPVPDGLGSRHGLLKAYFERRVLPPGGQSASERRRALDDGVEAVLKNKNGWLDSSSSATQLLSEGVLVQSFGEFAFRHALLRDFAAALFLGRNDATDIATRLSAVTNPTTRNDLLRAVMEARLDPSPISKGPNLEDVIRECAVQGLPPGIAIGSTDAPTPELVVAIASIDNGNVLRQAVTRAHLIGNRPWIRTIASIGGARPAWLGDTQLDAMSRLAQFALDTNEVTSVALARTLRTWTFGEMGDSWAIATILKLVTKLLADDDTLGWLASLSIASGVVSGQVLDEVREMLVAEPGLNPAAAERALRNLIFGSTGQRTLHNHERWVIANNCLRTRSNKRGLLDVRPEVAVPIVFELSATNAEVERRRRDARNQDPKLREAMEQYALTLPPMRSDLATAQERLERLPTMTEDEAWGGLVDDVPAFTGGHIDEVDELLDVTTALARDASRFGLVATAAARSRSVQARLIVLHESVVDRDGTIVTGLLTDPRPYHSVYALPEIHAAIARHWASLNSAAQASIQTNIFEMARSPLLRVTAVGRLASAVPRNDLDSRLVPYIEFLEQTGRPTMPGGPSRMTSLPPVYDDDNETAPEDQTTPRAIAFARLRDASKNPASEDAALALGDIVDNGYLDANTRHEVWFSVSSVISHDERAREPRLVSGTQARALFESSLKRAAAEDARADASLWVTLIDIADAGAGHRENQDDASMRERLIAEVEAAAGADAAHEEHATHALMFVRPWNWFHAGPGRALFVRWFNGSSLGAEALVAALGHLQYFEVKDRLKMLEGLLESTTRLVVAAETLPVFNDAGRQLGALSFWSEDPGTRDLFMRWCSSNARPGLLGRREYWRTLLDGFAWSLQHALSHSEKVQQEASKVNAAITRYADLATLAWSAWPAPGDDDRNAIGWALLAPLEQSYEGPERDWSLLLRSLLVAILGSAGHADLAAALLQFKWESCDPKTLADAVDAMIARATREPVGAQVLHELVGALGIVGCLRALPLTIAFRVLDCLETLGGSFPMATVAASRVESRIRVEQAGSSR